MKKSSVRNLTKTLAVVTLLAPNTGYSLGIGEIKLHSALNQNLDAEISLSLSGENISDIKVSLAPPEKFDEAGIAWTYFLSKIKFETISQSNNAAVIKLTSKEALKEPFLDFLLEVNWPKGNLYREFTVLVDPPSVYKQATIPVTGSTDGYRQPQVSSQNPLHANGQTNGAEYGPTVGNDTLWSVADRVRGQSDVSVEQMMMALYEANPHAFYKENVYALMTGKMLKVPEREAVLKLSRNQALAEFNRHKNNWKGRSSGKEKHALSTVEEPVLSSVEGPVLSSVEEPANKQLTLIAPTKETIAEHAVVSSAHEQADNKKIDKAKAEQETSKAISVDSSTQARVVELEKQLAMMQEMISLKDQQLAELQKQLQVNSFVQGQQPVPSAVVTSKTVEQIIAPAPQQTVAPPVQPVQPVQPAPSQVATSKPAVQPTPARPAKPAQPVIQPKPKAGNAFNLYYLVAGGAGTAALTLLGWLWWRKRKVEEETNTESMFASSNMIKTPEIDENLSVPIVEESVPRDAGTVGESSFLSEFTPSDFDSFDTDQGEIDPISEADVYLAYGRYQQAEELIRQAIKDQPGRDECKLKLLEIFYANENKAAFEAYATELAEAGRQDDAEFWEKAAEMGREISPDSPLFGAGGNLFAATDMGSAVEIDNTYSTRLDKENIDVGFSTFDDSDLEDFALETPEEPNNKPDFETTLSKEQSFDKEQKNNEDIDFDLSSFSMDSKSDDRGESDIASSPSSGLEREEIDFDLSFTTDAKDEADKISSSPVREPLEQFDFDSFSIDDTKEESGEDSSSANKEPKFESYEFDLGSNDDETDIENFDFTLPSNKDKDDVFAGESIDLDSDFDFDFDLPLTKSGSDSVQFEDLGVSDLTDMDELETKLDLAKAYVDMGDAEAARDIAKEVLEKGTDEQKKTAKTLLDELN